MTIGHEVRSFLPCRETAQRWLLGDSPALPEIMAAYPQALPESPPYSPLFMVPVVRACKQIVTIHDVIPEKFPPLA